MSVVEMSGFNGSMYISEELNRQLVNAVQEVTIRCISILASKYNFDAEEEIKLLGLDMLKVERKQSASASVGVKKVVSKEVSPKPRFPLPYNGEFNDNCCYALRQNNGLYTQCTGDRKYGDFCKGCASQLQKTGSEMPEYGRIQMRNEVDIFEYVDPKGRKPVAYTKIMNKYKVTEEEVLEEARKFNMEINRGHFAVSQESKRGRPKTDKLPKEKGAKGRPKKEKKVVMLDEESDDLFESLVAQANNVKPEVEKVEKDALSEEKKTEKAAKLATEKEEKAAKLAAEKAEKAAEKEEKAAKLAAEKEEKAAKLVAEKAEKAALAEQKKAEKAQKKAEKEQKNASKKPTGAKSKPEEAPEEGFAVKKIEFEGKKYLKSKSTGIIYDFKAFAENQESVVVGKWSDSLNKILFDDAEESEDEYDEESEVESEPEVDDE